MPQLILKKNTEFWHGLGLVISITSSNVQMQLQLTVACCGAFLLKLWIWQAFLSFHRSKNILPHPSFPDNLGKMAIRAMLWL
jgi:hypothetical protein